MDRTMQSAVFKGEGRVELEERPVPQVHGGDDVLLAVGAVGICGTDLHILNVPPEHPARVGTIMGHEFAGEVVAVGETVTSVRPGDYVIVDQNAPCGACEMCRRGLPNSCIPLRQTPGFEGMANTYGIFRDGALAKYVCVREFNVIPADRSLPMWQLAMAEPIASALNGFRKVKSEPGQSAVVLGAGPIGLIFASLFKSAGLSRLIVIEPSAIRRRAALECGAAIVVDPATEDVKERVANETRGRGADIVVEAVGAMLDTAVAVAAAGGQIVQFGHDETAWIKMRPAEIVRKELQIYGVFLAKFTFEAARELLEQQLLPLNRIVTHRLPLTKLRDGLGLLRRGEAIKVIIEPNDQ